MTIAAARTTNDKILAVSQCGKVFLVDENSAGNNDYTLLLSLSTPLTEAIIVDESHLYLLTTTSRLLYVHLKNNGAAPSVTTVPTPAVITSLCSLAPHHAAVMALTASTGRVSLILISGATVAASTPIRPDTTKVTALSATQIALQTPSSLYITSFVLSPAVHAEVTLPPPPQTLAHATTELGNLWLSLHSLAATPPCPPPAPNSCSYITVHPQTTARCATVSASSKFTPDSSYACASFTGVERETVCELVHGEIKGREGGGVIGKVGRGAYRFLERGLRVGEEEGERREQVKVRGGVGNAHGWREVS